MRSLLLSAIAVLLSLISPARGGEPEHQAEVQLEIVLSDGETPVAKAALHTDLQSQGTAFQGTATLEPPAGGRWIVSLSAYWGDEDPAKAELHVNVNDTNLIKETVHEGSKSIWPVEIFESTRRWRGPGRYRVGGKGNLVLSILVRDTPALNKKPEPAPAPEKK